MNAELGAAAEAVARYRDRMADLATSMQGNHEDLVSAIYEAERALLTPVDEIFNCVLVSHR
jgi:hypothetical protein